MDCSTPGFPVHHQHPELAQTHVHQVGDAIQPSHPLSSPSLLAFNLSQHQGLFQYGLCIKWPKYWSFSFSSSPSNEYSWLISFRIDNAAMKMCAHISWGHRGLTSPFSSYKRLGHPQILVSLEVLEQSPWGIDTLGGLYVFLWTYVFISPGYIPRSGIAGSHGNSMFKCSRNCQVVFQNGTTLHPHHWCVRAPVTVCPCQHLLISLHFCVHFRSLQKKS